MSLYEKLAQEAGKWRSQGYPSAYYPCISEILQWANDPDGEGFRLRIPQLRALETYWYLRLCEGTPHTSQLYRKMYPRSTELLAALGLDYPEIKDSVIDEGGVEAIMSRIRTDDEFAHRFRLEALRESLNLVYPSYIFALAMGAGKTVLIGTIFATEFAMALEYPDGPFVQNALVFAPGKTIIESLRQLAETPYDRIVPPRLHKPFSASVKLTFTRDGETRIPVVSGSYYNVIVTNTEKIRIQKDTIRRSDIGPLFAPNKEQEARARSEIANLRLQAIASLPNLAVFSDEAHHTYGQSLDTELKKVRKTVDYLAANTNVICVVNTTGTPYFKRQILRDVVAWYGLSQGIHDGILKELAGNIHAFSFDDDVEAYLSYVIEDFFKDYGEVTLPDGTPAKIAIYFPQTADVTALRPAIEHKLSRLGLSQSIVLEHHTAKENKAEFDRFKFKESPHRIALLVDRGVEGWDVPALFACALARRLKSSNNFVLQAACRCLRQIPGNKTKARVYLSADNRSILDRQLQETYGESVDDLNRTLSRGLKATIRLRKLDIPPLVIRELVRTVVPKDGSRRTVELNRPTATELHALLKSTYTVAEQKASHKVLKQVGDAETIDIEDRTIDLYAAAVELAAIYRLDLWTIYTELKHLYTHTQEIPSGHVRALAQQIEEQTRNYEVVEETVEKALALIKSEGFEKSIEQDTEVYTAEISYPVAKESLLQRWEEWREASKNFGFHYTPYNFDSQPEIDFFEQLLNEMNLHPGNVEDIYFTGALTDPKKTDFFVEYKGEDELWHRYTPDFIIRRKDDKYLIVEIKREHDRDHPVDGQYGRKAMATTRWVGLNPERLKYQLIFTNTDTVARDQLAEARAFVHNDNPYGK
jgi:type III restriction enzyme